MGFEPSEYNREMRRYDNPRSLKNRALAAWFRGGGGEITPHGCHTPRLVHDGRVYILIVNSKRTILKVYRVRNDGQLKGLKRWPQEFKRLV